MKTNESGGIPNDITLNIFYAQNDEKSKRIIEATLEFNEFAELSIE